MSRARSIMIQGTMSNAGKSLIAAGLCRIFRQDGLKAAPFKAQNMALNSYVTADGLEMGRAQAVQAFFAGVEPDVRMNPILLKPTGDTGSQVIVMGRVRGDYPARAYFAEKKKLLPVVEEAYRSLAEEYDVIVIEGAGSPVEINLKQDDIVNMGMARLAGAPVLLVGDIDRGGVFAQMAGTAALLEPWEKKYLKGLIVNKFRGDRSLLDPGLVMLEEKCCVPVAGAVPWMDVEIDAEDSLSGSFSSSAAGSLIDLAVIRLPRISNFTDFAPLDRIEGVGVRYVTSPRELGRPDLIFLPGTKNTMADLKWLRGSGLERAILALARTGTPVMGICGGYQMLGTRLIDPAAREEKSMEGLGLLPLETVFTDRKTRLKVSGHMADIAGDFAALSGARIEGYEIHMGQTHPAGSGEGEEATAPLTTLAAEREAAAGMEGAAAAAEDAWTRTEGAAAGTVLGTYVHGIFDTKEAAEGLVRALAARRGLEGMAFTARDSAEFAREQADLVADTLRSALDMEMIRRILREGVQE